MRDLTDAEDRVLADLAAAWNEATLLPGVHRADLLEFSQAIHIAENIIFARPFVEAQKGKRVTGVLT